MTGQIQISKDLHVQLQRVAKVGVCNLNAPLKVELSSLNDILFGFKLNTFCNTCVLDAMHNVNQYIEDNKEFFEEVDGGLVGSDEPVDLNMDKKRVLVLTLPDEFTEEMRDDLKKMFEESRPLTILNISTAELIEFKVLEPGDGPKEFSEEEMNVFNPFIEELKKPEPGNEGGKDPVDSDENTSSSNPENTGNKPTDTNKEGNVDNVKKDFKGVAVFTKAELKKMSLPNLQETAQAINAKFPGTDIPEITSKGQGVKEIEGKPKV